MDTDKAVPAITGFTCTRGYLGLEFVIPLHHISRPGHHLVPQLQCAYNPDIGQNSPSCTSRSVPPPGISRSDPDLTRDSCRDEWFQVPRKGPCEKGGLGTDQAAPLLFAKRGMRRNTLLKEALLTRARLTLSSSKLHPFIIAMIQTGNSLSVGLDSSPHIPLADIGVDRPGSQLYLSHWLSCTIFQRTHHLHPRLLLNQASAFHTSCRPTGDHMVRRAAHSGRSEQALRQRRDSTYLCAL